MRGSSRTWSAGAVPVVLGSRRCIAVSAARRRHDAAPVRHVGGADPVAVGDGGQPLHMGAQQLGEDLGLRLAQLRELLGDVRDRAVVLAELLAGGGVARPRVVAAYPSALSASASASVRSSARRPRSASRYAAPCWPTRARANAATASSPGRAAADRLGDPAQRVGGELVVRLVEGVPAALGQREDLGRTAAGAAAVDPLLAGLDEALGDQRVQVAADGGRGQPKTVGQVGGGGRAVVEDGAGDPVTGGRGGRSAASPDSTGAARKAAAVVGRRARCSGSPMYFTTPLLRNSFADGQVRDRRPGSWESITR